MARHRAPRVSTLIVKNSDLRPPENHQSMLSSSKYALFTKICYLSLELPQKNRWIPFYFLIFNLNPHFINAKGKLKEEYIFTEEKREGFSKSSLFIIIFIRTWSTIFSFFEWQIILVRNCEQSSKHWLFHLNLQALNKNRKSFQKQKLRSLSLPLDFLIQKRWSE